ncbi:hypothetical protein [Citrobacter sp. CtB7.12]|uniref:hypothetical protein n=1 Tax=Citrobacter sp. CtB7.12 TaxID=1696093 RepID=UPI0006BA5787|nr:hypothetical protein [Citrobacter sp. CtB7.12]
MYKQSGEGGKENNRRVILRLAATAAYQKTDTPLLPGEKRQLCCFICAKRMEATAQSGKQPPGDHSRELRG